MDGPRRRGGNEAIRLAGLDLALEYFGHTGSLRRAGCKCTMGGEMTKPYKYAGILAKKRQPPITHADKQSDAAFRIIYEIHTEDLVRALFADCKAGPRATGLGAAAPFGWRQVTMTLAERHVPGFQHTTGKRRGRPKRTDDAKIWVAMAKRLDKGQTIRQAAKYVAKERNRDESPAAIERSYRRFIKAYPELARR
jgi:hypothetical protein